MQVIHCTIVWRSMRKFYQIMIPYSSEQKFDLKSGPGPMILQYKFRADIRYCIFEVFFTFFAIIVVIAIYTIIV